MPFCGGNVIIKQKRTTGVQRAGAHCAKVQYIKVHRTKVRDRRRLDRARQNCRRKEL